jgi:hypothetical protein
MWDEFATRWPNADKRMYGASGFVAKWAYNIARLVVLGLQPSERAATKQTKIRRTEMPTVTLTDEQLAAVQSAGIINAPEVLDGLDDLIGKAFLIRTVTNYWTGRVVGRVGGLLQLDDAAWIADTGRFADALKTGELSEVEPTPDGFALVSIGAIIDIVTWSGDLPRKQK